MVNNSAALGQALQHLGQASSGSSVSAALQALKEVTEAARAHFIPCFRRGEDPRRGSARRGRLSGGRFGFGRSLDLGFCLGAGFLALQVGIPPFPLLSFIVLLAHNTLYIPNTFRLFEAL